MTYSNFQKPKKLVRDYFDTLETCEFRELSHALAPFFSSDYTFECSYPFMDKTGLKQVIDEFWHPLKQSLLHLQRRQDVFMAGVAKDNKTWVMSMGQFMGLFDAPFLNITPTYKIQHLQYAEYSCIENGKITHTAMFLDLIGFLNEAGIFPIPFETGHYFTFPGPRDHNGLLYEDAPYEKAAYTLKIVENMIDDLCSLNVGNETPVEILERSFTKDMIWYGPAGIGASYTIPRYQLQHQIPFRTQLENKSTNEIHSYFAEGDFVCFYTSMEVTPTGGWLGMPAFGKQTHLRGDIDIYYCKDGKISENWCFIDLPYWLSTQGVEIFK